MYIKFKNWEFKMDNFYLLYILSTIMASIFAFFLIIALLAIEISKKQNDDSSVTKNNIENVSTNDNQQISPPDK